MGTWGYGPFDNDTAADFAGNLRDRATTGERMNVLALALFESIFHEPEPVDLSVYALGWKMETGVAAAAFVADARTGQLRFTDSVYARGLGDGDELNPPVELEAPEPRLVKLAGDVIAKVVSYMRANKADTSWIEEVEAIGAALAASPASPE